MLLPITFPSFLVAKTLELRHRRTLNMVTIDSIQISPRLFDAWESCRSRFGSLPVHFRLPNTWTLKIPVPSPLNYTLTMVTTPNARHVYERTQNRAFYSVLQLLTTHANQTLWASHAVNTWEEERMYYSRTDDGRIEPWNRKTAVATDSGCDSIADCDVPMRD